MKIVVCASAVSACAQSTRIATIIQLQHYYYRNSRIVPWDWDLETENRIKIGC